MWPAFLEVLQIATSRARSSPPHVRSQRPRFATAEELSRFHSDDYVDFLRRVTPENCKALSSQLQKCECRRRHRRSRLAPTYAVAPPADSIGEFTDCPVFDGLYRFCQAFAGGSIDAAGRLNHGQADVAINWAGGLHHAKKVRARAGVGGGRYMHSCTHPCPPIVNRVSARPRASAT